VRSFSASAAVSGERSPHFPPQIEIVDLTFWIIVLQMVNIFHCPPTFAPDVVAHINCMTINNQLLCVGPTLSVRVFRPRGLCWHSLSVYQTKSSSCWSSQLICAVWITVMGHLTQFQNFKWGRKMDDLGTNIELFRAVGYWYRVCTSFLVKYKSLLKIIKQN